MGAQHTPGPFRVVEREFGGPRIWDVWGDHLDDYLATMNPTLPVSRRETAERICNEANAAIAKARGAA